MAMILLLLAAIIIGLYAWSQLSPQSLQALFSVPANRQATGMKPVDQPSSLSATNIEISPSAASIVSPPTPVSLDGVWPPLLVHLRTWVHRTRAWLILITVIVSLYTWSQFLAQNYAWSVTIPWIVATCAFIALVAEPPSWRVTIPRTEWILCGVVMLVGIALRLYRIDDVPFGLNHDASYSGLVALLASHSSSYIPWSPDPTQGETFFDYWIVAAIAVFGPVPIAIKGAATVVGILTLVGMYLFTRRLLDTRAALVATLLLGTSGWHLIFSRVGWRMITLPFVETFAFYFLFRAFDTRKRGSFAVVGALLALQLDTYLAGRVLLVVAVGWTFVEFWRGPDRLGLLRGVGIAIIAFLVAGASVLSFALTNPDAWGARYNSVSIIPQILAGNWQPLIDNIKTTLGLFTVRANGNDFFIDQPLLDPPTRWLFVLGLGVALWMVLLKRRRYGFILLGLVLALLPGLVAIEPNGNRNSATMPFVYILAALPLVALLDVTKPLRQYLPGLLRLVPEAVVTIVLLGSIVGVYNQYLGSNRAQLWGFYPETTVVGRYIHQIDRRYDSYVTDNFPRDALTYLTYQAGDPIVGIAGSGYPLQPHYVWQDNNQAFLSDRAQVGRGLAFFMAPGVPQNDAMMATLQRRYRRAVAFDLVYKDDNIDRPASVVVLVPPPGDDARILVPPSAGVSG